VIQPSKEAGLLKSTFLRARARASGRYAVVTALILAIGIPTVAIGAGEGRSLIAGKRNPRAGGELTRETEIIAQNGTYGTRQSNKQDGDGGGAIYGCRSNPGAEPCVRANNLKGGRAFEFDTVGKEGGNIHLNDATGVPFTTNATGKVANLNVDRLDDKDSADFAATGDLLFAAVAADSTLGAKRGATAAVITNGAENTYAITFARDVSACSYTASAVGTANADLAFGVAANPANKNQVLVDQIDDPADPTSFYLQVIC
jgi:hypothetical protein